MPTYEYECKSCAHHFEAFQSMRDTPLKSCPRCGKDVRRLIKGGSGVIFKGSGFYVTDKKDSKTGTSAAKSAAASEGAKTPDKASEASDTKTPAGPAESKTGSGSAEKAAQTQGGAEKKAAG